MRSDASPAASSDETVLTKIQRDMLVQALNGALQALGDSPMSYDSAMARECGDAVQRWLNMYALRAAERGAGTLSDAEPAIVATLREEGGLGYALSGPDVIELVQYIDNNIPIQLRTALRPSPGTRRDAYACPRCKGRGKVASPCSMCHDSTWDHACPDDVSCTDCTGTGSIADRRAMRGDGRLSDGSKQIEALRSAGVTAQACRGPLGSYVRVDFTSWDADSVAWWINELAMPLHTDAALPSDDAGSCEQGEAQELYVVYNRDGWPVGASVRSHFAARAESAFTRDSGTPLNPQPLPDGYKFGTVTLYPRSTDAGRCPPVVPGAGGQTEGVRDAD